MHNWQRTPRFRICQPLQKSRRPRRSGRTAWAASPAPAWLVDAAWTPSTSTADVLGRRRRHDAVAEIEHVAGLRAGVRDDDARRSAFDGRRVGEQRERIEIALEGDAVAMSARARLARSTVQSRPTHDAPGFDDRGERVAAVLGEHDRRHMRRAAAARIARIGSSEKRRYSAAGSKPPHVSNSITASTPAAICSRR